MVDCILETPLRRLSIEEINQVMGMVMTGASLRTIAAHTNMSHDMIKRVRLRFDDTESVQHRHDGVHNRYNSQGRSVYCNSVTKEYIFYS